MPDDREAGSLYIGLMSGTSMDGIDAAIVEFGDHTAQLIATLDSPYPEELRNALHKASRKPAECTVDTVGQLDRRVGECFRDAVNALLENAHIEHASIGAIGSHGQTLRHQPGGAHPFSMQIGDPNIIAAGTGITTVADFRRRDVALGGEGAPLAPAFHQWLFAHEEKDRAVLNIGGIANVTMLLRGNTPVTGFDTGPGNTLLDAWSRRARDLPFDDKGGWAASGTVCEPLLATMLEDPYFALPPPKSTGFEYFNGAWIRSRIDAAKVDIADADVQATLAELSARTIAMAILQYAPVIDKLLICGGGINNADLLHRLASYLTGIAVESTEEHGVHPDWVEAAAFAWLAKRCIAGEPGNLPEVTGASRSAVLGGIYH